MLATTASATAATRLHRILKEHGISAEITGTPAMLAAGGCGYSLRFSDSELPETVPRIASRYGIKVRAVWRETGNPAEPYRKVYG